MSETVHFSPRQLKFIDWLALPRQERVPLTQVLLAQELRLHPRTLSRWRKKAELQAEVMQRVREMLGDDLPEIYGALRREAIAGSFHHIRLALKMTGEFTEEQILTVKLEREMNQVLDVLEKELDVDAYRRILTALSSESAGGK